jgi:hypothetical protein
VPVFTPVSAALLEQAEAAVTLERGSAPKIFVVGLPKSGTSSVHYFLQCGGVVSSHHACDGGHCGKCIRDNVLAQRDPLHECGSQYKAYTQMDLTFNDGKNCFYPQISALAHLHEYYPDSVFILNLRPVDAWVKSVLRWNDLAARLQRCFKWRGLNISRSLHDFYVEHTNFVADFAREHKHRLMVLDITSKGAAFIMEQEFGIPRVCWTRQNASPHQT